MAEKHGGNAAWDRWLDGATHALRNHPDWASARRELLDHLEDKTADLERIFPDMTREEAEELALSKMGDPEEIGRALTQAHNKVLGGLYWLCQGLIMLTELAMVLILPFYLWTMVLPLLVPNWPF